MATVAYPGTPGTVIYGGLPTPSGGTALTTITLANTSATEQSAGFVSPMFGLPLKQGDVPAGQYPAFELADGTPVPATIHSVTSWPDGSMKWCGVFLRVPTIVAGSGSLAITVKNGGSAPGSSARAISDLTAADLKVELTGVTNLTGTWTASLNDAITNGTVVVIGDGPAGMLVRILGDFKQGGSAHGQLVNWHYALIAQNSSGGLLGIRYLGRVAQPWADVSSPTPTRRVVNAVLKAGASTLRTLQGHDTTETVGANIGFGHYTSFFTAGTDGKWDYVQGGGSASADCTVRVVHDKTYVVKSRLVPPYNTAQAATSSTSVDYVPYTAAGMLRSMGNGGERLDIGVLTSWAARHLLTQAAVDERVIRVVGLASGGWRTCLRKQSTKQVIATIDASPSYTGLGTIQTTWRWLPNDDVTGVQLPVSNTTLWSSEYESSHRPAATYYPYLVTGEPQYLDMLVEQAAELTLTIGVGGRTMNVTPPITVSTLKATGSDSGERNATIAGTTYKGGGWVFQGYLIRIQAWMARDLAEAAAIYPDTCPSGTETRKYLREVVEAGWSAINAYNAAIGAPWSESGIYCFDPVTETASPWLSGYMSNAVCHAASILPSTSANTFRQHLSRHWEQISAACDLASAISYRGNAYDETDTRVSRSDEMLFQIPSTLTFSTATNRFTVSGVTGSWSPTNGDVIAFDTLFDADKPFTEATNRRRLYVVNASGNTGQLSLTPGGSPITVTSNAVVAQFWARLQNFAPHFSAENDLSGPDSYIANIASAIRHHKAVGDSVTSAETEVSTLLSTAATVFSTDPKNALVAAYPS